MSKFLNSRKTSFWIAANSTDAPVFHELPRLEGNFARTYSTTTDETVVQQREAKSSVKTGSDVAGDFSCNFRLSKHYELMRQGAMQSADPVTISATVSLTYTKANKTLTAADTPELAKVKKGMYFKLTQDGKPDVIAFAVADFTSTGGLVSGIADTADATQEFTSLATKYLVTSDKQLPFYIQKRVAGKQSATNDADKVFYRSFNGCEVFTWGLNMATEAIITESYNLTGLSLLGDADDWQIPSQSDAPKSEYPLTDALGSVKGVQHIDFNGERHNTCFAQSFEFSLDNQGEASKAIGTEGACALTYKDPVITASVSTYSVNYDPFAEEKIFDADTTFPVAFTLYDQVQDSYMTISGNAKFSSLDTDLSGNSAVKNMGLSYEGSLYVYMM